MNDSGSPTFVGWRIFEANAPAVHDLDHRGDAVAAIAQHFADLLLLQGLGRLAGATRELEVMRNESISWIAREQNDLRAAAFRYRDEIFPGQLIPPVRFRPLLEAVVRINDPGMRASPYCSGSSGSLAAWFARSARV